MPTALNTTPGHASANSYVTLAEASTYVDDNVVSSDNRTTWTSASDDDRTRALTFATTLLDKSVEWDGCKATEEQALQWPREGVLDDNGFSVDETIIPLAVKKAQTETALWLLQNGGEIPQLASSQFDSLKVGAITLDFNEKAGVRAQKILPEYIGYLLIGLGIVKQVGGLQVAKLIRA